MNESNLSDDALAELLTLTVEVNDYGTTYYRNQSEQVHRVHGPAIIYETGGCVWYLNSRIHRTGGPAVEYSDGSKEWFHHGTLHREDGPAVEWSDGDCDWWLNGEHLDGEAEYTAQLVLLSLPSKR